MNNTYKVNVYCQNCDFKGEIDIEKGIAIEDYSCSKCGMKKLAKISGPARITPMNQDNK